MLLYFNRLLRHYQHALFLRETPFLFLSEQEGGCYPRPSLIKIFIKIRRRALNLITKLLNYDTTLSYRNYYSIIIVVEKKKTSSV